MNEQDMLFLLESYGEEYGPEAGPWNTSVQSKYLEYRISSFFEEHFPVAPGAHICNIGIGVGNWDRTLSYLLKGGQLVSIDIDERCCRQLVLRLRNEKNPNPVRVIHSDVLFLDDLENRFDIVTIIGSTRRESGQYAPILCKAISFVKPGGCLYYQTLDEREDKASFAELCRSAGMQLKAYLLDTSHGFHAQYFKATK